MVLGAAEASMAAERRQGGSFAPPAERAGPGSQQGCVPSVGTILSIAKASLLPILTMRPSAKRSVMRQIEDIFY